jgi:hypothetical protein
MTDASAERAYPPEPEQPEEQAGPSERPTAGEAPDAPARGDAFAPAAHGHPLGADAYPAVSSSRTAVLESRPPFGFPGEQASIPVAFAPPAEPPPFGFNSPPRPEAPAAEPAEEPAQSLAGVPTPTPTAAPLPAPPPVATGPAPRPTLPPRELMPTVAPVARNRFGESPTPTFGPPGRPRSVPAMVALSVLTLGFYAVAWHRRVNHEMADFDPRVHVEPGRSAWAVALPLLLGLLATAAAGARIALGHLGVSVSLPMGVDQAMFGLGALLAVPYLVLFLPFSVVAVAMTAERVRVVEEHAGLTGDEQIRPAALLGWLLVPVIGGFVVMGRQQRALNRIWDLARG